MIEPRAISTAPIKIPTNNRPDPTSKPNSADSFVIAETMITIARITERIIEAKPKIFKFLIKLAYSMKTL